MSNLKNEYTPDTSLDARYADAQSFIDKYDKNKKNNRTVQQEKKAPTVEDVRKNKTKLEKAKTDSLSALSKWDYIYVFNQNLKTYWIEANKNDPNFDPTDIAGKFFSYQGTSYRLTDIFDNIRNAPIQKTLELEKLKDIQTKLDAANYQLTIAGLPGYGTPGSSNYVPPKVSSSSSGPSKDGGTIKGIEFSKDYQYNAPMVSSAYWGNSLESTILEGNLVDQGKYGDAREAWKGTTGGRGTIQMDEKFLKSFKNSTESPEKLKLDTQKYGFKFLYNPQTVQMAWGVLSYMSPPFEMSGQDVFQPVSTGLLVSAISFEILLNRIKDFDYLNEDGLINPSQLTDTGEYIVTSTSRNPYPETIDSDDLKEIYQKGTMYDIEYLLKVLNGPHTRFESRLSGLMTADRAYLTPNIVELHLGANLRYRVRIGQFSVNHIMFNPRMVPILSSVKLDFRRLPDGPEVQETFSTNSSNTLSSVDSGRQNQQSKRAGAGRGD